MRMVKKIVAGIAVLLVAAAALLFLSYDRIIVAILEKSYNLDIRYVKCSKDFSGKLNFKDLSVVSKPAGRGIISRTAELRPSFLNKRFVVAFNFQDVSFKKEAVNKPEKYDTLAALLSTPFSSDWRYRPIRGVAEPTAKSIKIKEFEAVSDDLKLSLTGELFYTGGIDFDIVIGFAPSLTAKIPPEFANTILDPDKDGWKSLSARISGDPNKPSIQVSSRLFRLKINALSGT